MTLPLDSTEKPVDDDARQQGEKRQRVEAQGLVALLRRLGQVAQESGLPSGPEISGPPQEPRRQGRSKITPTAIMSMTNPMTPRTRRKTVMDPF